MGPEYARFEALEDEALERYLTDEAALRRERLVIVARGGAWIAETYLRDEVSSGRSVMLNAMGHDRRTAMLGLAEQFKASR
jgi:hypothetical protein